MLHTIFQNTKTVYGSALIAVAAIMLAAAAPAQAGADLTQGISGQIKLGKKVKLKPGMVLFLSARPIAGGPPMAVQRVMDPKFPFDFNLNASNSMTGAPLQGEAEVTARLDQDGDAMTHQPGDYFGKIKTKVGDEPVKLTIDQEIK